MFRRFKEARGETEYLGAYLPVGVNNLQIADHLGLGRVGHRSNHVEVGAGVRMKPDLVDLRWEKQSGTVGRRRIGIGGSHEHLKGRIEQCGMHPVVRVDSEPINRDDPIASRRPVVR